MSPGAPGSTVESRSGLAVAAVAARVAAGGGPRVFHAGRGEGVGFAEGNEGVRKGTTAKNWRWVAEGAGSGSGRLIQAASCP